MKLSELPCRMVLTDRRLSAFPFVNRRYPSLFRLASDPEVYAVCLPVTLDKGDGYRFHSGENTEILALIRPSSGRRMAPLPAPW